MGTTGNDIQLLLPREVDELHGITADTDREVGILLLLGMFHTVDKFLYAKDIDVQMVCAAVEVSVQDTDEGVYTLLIIMSKRIRADGLCVGDSVKRILIRELCR